VTAGSSILLVDGDAQCGRALAALLRRQGHVVRLVGSSARALQAVRRDEYELAIVDLFVDGGGLELARALGQRVGKLLLSVGAPLADGEILQAAFGFSVHRKVELPHLFRGQGAASNGGASAGKSAGSRRPSGGSSAPARGPGGRGRRRDRPS
jgi:CheY-like chemotaxis protein